MRLLSASAFALLAACGDPMLTPGSPTGSLPDLGTSGASRDFAVSASPDLKPPAAIDDAVIVSSTLPASLGWGSTFAAQVVVQNSGTTTWTPADGFKLGAVGDSDPFAATRVSLPDGTSVAPGAMHTFAIAMTAPLMAGDQVSDWQMVHEGVRWFGAIATQKVAVGAFDFAAVQIYNSPSDIATWPETAKITKLDFGDGIFVDFTKRATSCGPAGPPGVWPDVPFGGDGSLEYTIWMVEQINGKWYASGGIEYWCDDHYILRNGGPPSGFGMNWYYDANRWGMMANRQPAVGELVGFFVSAGDARNNGATVIKERSNIVFVPFPSDAGATFNY